MVFAVVGDNAYKVLLLGHIVSFLVAFGPAVTRPPHLTARVNLPAIIVTGAFGLGLVLASDETWAFDQAWVSLSFLVWIAICGVVSGLLLPAERKIAAGDASAERLVERGGQIIVVLVTAMLYLMIWKPGA